MRLNKKTLVPLCIILGIIMMASTAFAEVVNRSAYDQLKDAVKTTSARMAAGVNNYTLKTNLVLSGDGVVLMSEVTSQKIDGNKSESSGESIDFQGLKRINYSYSSNTQSIWYNSFDDTYYVNEYQIEGSEDSINWSGNSMSYDPLADEHIADLERILDAAVGNLRSYVTVAAQEDGSRIFAGSLSDTQIPALINAVASFATKQFLGSSVTGMQTDASYASYRGTAIESDNEKMAGASSINPALNLKGDVFIRQMAGTAKADPDGLLTAATFNIVLSGRDADGQPHDLVLDVNLAMSDIGTTVVNLPDLTGKNVVVSQHDKPSASDRLSAKFAGTYRNDIIVEEDGSFVKIGERTVVIESIDSDQVSGRYYETWHDGSDNSATAFTFEAPNIDPYGISFTYTNAEGLSGNGSIYFQFSGSLQLYLDEWGKYEQTNPNFSLVFD
jgi:hypothetical protein